MSKVVVVTGASKGIGAATAIAFGKAGYDVVVNYRSDVAIAEQVVQKINELGQQAVAVRADVFTEQGIQKLFHEVRTKFSKIDVFVNNAGNAPEPDFGKYTHDEVSKALSDNFGTVALCTQEALKVMDKGSILFTSSVYGLNFNGNPNKPLYSASKAAMINFVESMAERLTPDIRCNSVAPGHTLTEGRKSQDKEYADKMLNMTLQKEWVAPEEIAAAFVFLAETPHITGQTIVVDAGWQKKIR